MSLSSMIVPILILAAAAEDKPIIVKAYPWAPFISPMGEPFRPPSKGEAPIERWFNQADRNHDGMLTPEEMQADADRFFARLDSNHDSQIDPQEITAYEWEVAPDVQVNSQWKRPRGEVGPEPKSENPDDSEFRKAAGDRHDGYHADGLQGAARYGLLNIPQPVASADADFNRLITLAEFRQAASYRFKLLDDRSQGRLTLAELATRLPNRPKGKPARPGKEAVDTRIGQPLPKGD